MSDFSSDRMVRFEDDLVAQRGHGDLPPIPRVRFGQPVNQALASVQRMWKAPPRKRLQDMSDAEISQLIEDYVALKRAVRGR